MSARNSIRRADAWIGDVRNERCPELPDFGGEGLWIEDVAGVVADIDDRRREVREDAQHLEINLAVVAYAQNITRLKDVTVDDNGGLHGRVGRDKVADCLHERGGISIAGMKIGNEDKQKVRPSERIRWAGRRRHNSRRANTEGELATRQRSRVRGGQRFDHATSLRLPILVRYWGGLTFRASRTSYQ